LSLQSLISGSERANLEGLEKQLGTQIPVSLKLILEVGAIWFYDRRGFRIEQIMKIVADGSLPEGIVPFVCMPSCLF